MKVYKKVLSCLLMSLLLTLTAKATSSGTTKKDQISPPPPATEENCHPLNNQEEDQDPQKSPEEQAAEFEKIYQERLENFEERVSNSDAKKELLSFLSKAYDVYEDNLSTLPKPFLVKILIHGPKGCGKSFLAKEVGKVLIGSNLIADGISLINNSPKACLIDLQQILMKHDSVIIENFDNFLLFLEGLANQDSSAFDVERSIVDIIESNSSMARYNQDLRVLIVTVDHIKSMPSAVLKEFNHIVQLDYPKSREQKVELVERIISNYDIQLAKDLDHEIIYNKTKNLTPKRIVDLFQKAEQFAIESEEENISKANFEKAAEYLKRMEGGNSTLSYYS